ncbi:MAG: hypothetical protein J2P17_19155, partial [Mycobacterium sp.]|nr:hypothetical protein [Mycobacterium sp.]
NPDGSADPYTSTDQHTQPTTTTPQQRRAGHPPADTDTDDHDYYADIGVDPSLDAHILGWDPNELTRPSGAPAPSRTTPGSPAHDTTPGSPRSQAPHPLDDRDNDTAAPNDWDDPEKPHAWAPQAVSTDADPTAKPATPTPQPTGPTNPETHQQPPTGADDGTVDPMDLLLRPAGTDGDPMNLDPNPRTGTGTAINPATDDMDMAITDAQLDGSADHPHQPNTGTTVQHHEPITTPPRAPPADLPPFDITITDVEPADPLENTTNFDTSSDLYDSPNPPQGTHTAEPGLHTPAPDNNHERQLTRLNQATEPNTDREPPAQPHRREFDPNQIKLLKTIQKLGSNNPTHVATRALDANDRPVYTAQAVTNTMRTIANKAKNDYGFQSADPANYQQLAAFVLNIPPHLNNTSGDQLPATPEHNPTQARGPLNQGTPATTRPRSQRPYARVAKGDGQLPRNFFSPVRKLLLLYKVHYSSTHSNEEIADRISKCHEINMTVHSLEGHSIEIAKIARKKGWSPEVGEDGTVPANQAGSIADWARPIGALPAEPASVDDDVQAGELYEKFKKIKDAPFGDGEIQILIHRTDNNMDSIEVARTMGYTLRALYRAERAMGSKAGKMQISKNLEDWSGQLRWIRNNRDRSYLSEGDEAWIKNRPSVDKPLSELLDPDEKQAVLLRALNRSNAAIHAANVLDDRTMRTLMAAIDRSMTERADETRPDEQSPAAWCRIQRLLSEQDQGIVDEFLTQGLVTRVEHGILTDLLHPNQPTNQYMGELPPDTTPQTTTTTPGPIANQELSTRPAPKRPAPQQDPPPKRRRGVPQAPWLNQRRVEILNLRTIDNETHTPSGDLYPGQPTIQNLTNFNLNGMTETNPTAIPNARTSNT